MTDAEQATYAAAQVREGLADLEEAHDHAGLIQDDGKRNLISFLATIHDGDVTDTEVYQDIVRNEATDSLTDAVAEGNVSQMQYAVGMVNHSENRSESGQSWMREQQLSEAYVGWVTEGMGSGKTDFALDRADDWHHATRGRIATNIQSAAKKNDQVEYVDGFEDLKEFFQEASSDALAVIDETDQNLSGKGSDQQNAEKVAAMLKLIRKGDGSDGSHRGIFLVGQTIRGASKELRRLVTSNGHLYHKATKKKVEVYDDVVTGEIRSKTPERVIRGVKPTRFGFNSGEASNFDMSAAETDDDSLTERERDIRTAVRAVELQDLSYRKAASILDNRGKTWVGSRYREWRDEGKHEFVGVQSPASERTPDHE